MKNRAGQSPGSVPKHPTSTNLPFSIFPAVLILRAVDSVEIPFGLSVNIHSVPGSSAGRIPRVSFKRNIGILQPSDDAKDVNDGETKTLAYAGFGSDIHPFFDFAIAPKL